jgi:hypothetical protein
MASGRDHSRFQQGVIKRYYRNLDAISLQKLGEIVTELYLAEAGGEKKKADGLWKRADTALAKSAEKDSRVAAILEQRDVEQLAKLVGELSG